MKPRSALNRLLLGLAGLVLLGGGLLVLTPGLDLYRRLHLPPPAGWPLTTPDNVLLNAADRTRWSSQGWWWPLVIATLALIALLALAWLVTQLRRHHPGGMPLGGTPPHEGVELRDRALSNAVAAEAGDLPDVRRATAHITGSATHPHLHVTLTLAAHGAPAAVLRDLCSGPLEHARRSCGWQNLPTEARLHVTGHKPRRAQ
ncbi:alkaline shock response membrane anchor protein AmaP [Streptomyces sp. F001]|uniref:alkaline shock response membrane anchor protein AmaP n=1 Tax=Streptomyces sp. F001 TaxID=1510026 RepID=UPI00101E4DBF|nr:alkaline shock response membrane anchor protein AmaP [Streptomyces sp. F001]RZB13272.1 alkaline shock response membrane anchor protein AmaP [Streptomyces sp. F001]